MAHRLTFLIVLLLVLIASSLPADAGSSAAGRDDDPAAPPPGAAEGPQSPPAAPGSTEIQVPPPPLSTENFPCSDCHEPGDKTNPTRRVLTEYHQEIELRHDEQNRWCLDCHDEHDRDHLHLANGTLISFERSYLLCGQCHGPTLRSWKAGVHGKRTGRWDGKERYYLLCVHCHYPHQPHFPQLRPMPPPIAPDDLRASLERPIRPLVLESAPVFSAPPDDKESGDGKPGDSDAEDGNDAR
ncbi:MAG TPA: hypothetical protein VL049_28495 [Candidatus Dormibacteraeota bacterium]|nr:hypothetical protein [Candidatus Dormibacteraeota bacterium]